MKQIALNAPARIRRSLRRRPLLWLSVVVVAALVAGEVAQMLKSESPSHRQVLPALTQPLVMPSDPSPPELHRIPRDDGLPEVTCASGREPNYMVIESAVGPCPECSTTPEEVWAKIVRGYPGTKFEAARFAQEKPGGAYIATLDGQIRARYALHSFDGGGWGVAGAEECPELYEPISKP